MKKERYETNNNVTENYNRFNHPKSKKLLPGTKNKISSNLNKNSGRRNTNSHLLFSFCNKISEKNNRLNNKETIN